MAFCRLELGDYIVNNTKITLAIANIFDVYLPHRDRQTFAATRPSSVLLEQLSVCVTKGEPVLLVGETGTGKTSTVQYLAGMTGNTPKLH